MKKFNNIRTMNELADFLKIPRKRLTHILIHVDNLYTTFEIPKKSGGTREINAPSSKELKESQIKLAESLYKHIKKTPKYKEYCLSCI